MSPARKRKSSSPAAHPSPLDIDGAELESLQRGRHSDPHRILGAHPASRGEEKGVVVRVYRPNATRVELLPGPGTSEQEGLALEERRAGLFAIFLPGVSCPYHYQLRFHFADGNTDEREDPYSFLPTLGEHDLHFFSEGTHRQLWKMLGAHPHIEEGTPGVAFAVWAPNAKGVSVVGDFCCWDGRIFPMRSLGSSGVFELFLPRVAPGALYKFEIQTRDGAIRSKADPFACWSEPAPGTASRVAHTEHRWQDETWMRTRPAADPRSRPMATYELHLASWARVPDEGDRALSYRELAPRLIAHLERFGFTHVEFMPVAEYPFDGSWGYQVTGYYAPTSRFGEPDDLRFLIDQLHQHDIGVILDWVPAHFPKDDFALRQFDGTPLYEHSDERRGEHPDWGTLIFNYGRNEIKNFLIANALYWFDEFHVDGLRVDAVASMLYLDYSRKEGEWLPNQFGGRENFEAIDFLRELNRVVAEECPGCITIAEESTSWPGVTAPTEHGGLGFTFKWNMGWMNDTLTHFAREPIHRGYHQNSLTFAMLYEYSEHFIMPLSHDEVVHGKGSLLNKMPGDDWQRFANLRLLLSYQYTRPGKKLLFMGIELAQDSEWDHQHSLPWHLWQDPQRAAFAGFLEELGHLYLDTPALWEADSDPNGFEWIDAGDHANSVLTFIRRSGWRKAVVALNLTPVPRDGYRVGVPEPGLYVERFSSDAQRFGGSDFETLPHVQTDPVPAHGHPQSICVQLPPLGALILEMAPEIPRTVEPTRPRLRALAKQCGILPGYEGVDGAWHPTSDETRMALLAAMGLEAEDEASAAARLCELTEREASCLIPPTRVLREGSDEAAGFTVPIAEADRAHPITWHLEILEEGGATRQSEGTDHPIHGELYIAIPEAATLAPGYHRLRLLLCTGPGHTQRAEQRYIQTPRTCLTPESLLGDRACFGITTNLYSVRSEGDWGVGDFADLRTLIDWARSGGASFLGINPLHALANTGPGVSPYYPLSRLYRNLLYLDLRAVPELESSDEARRLLHDPGFQDRLAQLRAADCVEYSEIFALKRQVLALLYPVFAAASSGEDRKRAHADFVEREGEALQRFARFEALRTHFGNELTGGEDWRNWPDEFQSPSSPAVARFAREHSREIEFQTYIQFELDRQLGEVQEAAQAKGMPIGILHDLALGSHPGGCDTWSFPELLARGAAIGAPPDPLAEQGQNWGLPPLNPFRLKEDGYRLWSQLLRRAFQSGGALRIDHVMGLDRQFWIPDTVGTPGAYVEFPKEDLMGILALESQRAGAIVIGEDLGTVPHGFREDLADWGILRTQVLYFERDGAGDFHGPEAYARLAFTTVNTHDLATLHGYASGEDLKLRTSLGLLSQEELTSALVRREEDLRALRARLVDQELLDESNERRARNDPKLLGLAATEFLASTPSLLVGCALDDLAGESEAINLPGVQSDQHPSWTRRMGRTLEEIFSLPQVGEAFHRLQQRALPKTSNKDLD